MDLPKLYTKLQSDLEKTRIKQNQLETEARMHEELTFKLLGAMEAIEMLQQESKENKDTKVPLVE